MKRATLGTRSPAASKIGAYNARPRVFAARRSDLPLRTYAGAEPIASMTRCSVGRTRDRLGGRRAATAPGAWAARTRFPRCARSASSSCSAPATASRTGSETPVAVPRSSRV